MWRKEERERREERLNKVEELKETQRDRGNIEERKKKEKVRVEDAEESEGALERLQTVDDAMPGDCTRNMDARGWLKGTKSVGWLGSKGTREHRRVARKKRLDIYVVRMQEGEKKQGREKGEKREPRRRWRRRPASKEITIFAYVNYRLTRMNDRPG